MKSSERTVRQIGSRYEIKLAGTWQKVATVDEAAKRLGKTRRHVYRYLKEGTLLNFGKFLGAWLLDEKTLDLLAKNPSLVASVPISMQLLFPEYDIKSLNLMQDRVIVISRILDDGGVEELKWLLRMYSLPIIQDTLKCHGARLLRSRSFNFWLLFFAVKRPAANWRNKENPWRSRNEVA